MMKKEVMIINNYKHENGAGFKIYSYDEKGKGWCLKFHDDKEEALIDAKETLQEYNRNHYKIIDKTRSYMDQISEENPIKI